jgi:hypothetical protein
MTLIDKIAQGVRDAGWKVRVDSGWSGWDMEVYGSRYVKVRLTTATEHHHHKGKLTRIRVESLPSHFTLVLLAASCVLAGLLLLKMWPFSRTAVLIPLAWWSMYVVNRWRVTGPVLGLIDSVATKLNYWAVPAQPVVEVAACNEAQGVPSPVAAEPPAAEAPAQAAADSVPGGAQPSVA